MISKKIVIVGGGTAGWMTAAYLAKYRGGENITLIESPNIESIGVGESVTPHVSNFFDEIGINEFDWMRETGAIHKFANKFINWNGADDEQYFSFTYTTPSTNFCKDIAENKTQDDFTNITKASRSIDIISDLFKKGEIDRFDRYFNPQFHYMERNVAPYLNNEKLLNQPFSHAHHINAELASEYIKNKVAKPYGVVHILADVINVCTSNKKIDYLELDDNRKIKADLYIDCTGLKRLLVNALNWDVKYYDSMIDSAWVTHTEYENAKKEMVNYTQSIAEPHGWRFKIGLYHRMGNGYCFSSNHISNEDALHYFEKQIGKTRKKPRLLKWKPSRLEKFGEGNCAAIGLSCGFIEPLEANALYTIITAIRRLNNVLDSDVLDFTTYNKKMQYTIDDIYDFIIVHYTLSSRNDTQFWRDMQELGMNKNHKELVVNKINNERNTMQSAIKGYTMFPDYMWAQLALSWNINLNITDTPEHLKKLGLNYYNYTKDKHSYISSLCENNYEWLSKNVFHRDHKDFNNTIKFNNNRI